jgi:nicotinic acid mononucleotide adenylyltransferase
MHVIPYLYIIVQDWSKEYHNFKRFLFIVGSDLLGQWAKRF